MSDIPVSSNQQLADELQAAEVEDLLEGDLLDRVIVALRATPETPAECIHNWVDHPKVARWMVCTKCRDVYEPDMPAVKAPGEQT